jgi:hypothetical protein
LLSAWSVVYPMNDKYRLSNLYFKGIIWIIPWEIGSESKNKTMLLFGSGGHQTHIHLCCLNRTGKSGKWKNYARML